MVACLRSLAHNWWLDPYMTTSQSLCIDRRCYNPRAAFWTVSILHGRRAVRVTEPGTSAADWAHWRRVHSGLPGLFRLLGLRPWRIWAHRVRDSQVHPTEESVFPKALAVGKPWIYSVMCTNPLVIRTNLHEFRANPDQLHLPALIKASIHDFLTLGPDRIYNTPVWVHG